MRRSTWATPGPMSRCSAPLGDRDHAPTRVKFAKSACGWLAAALPPAPEHVVTPVERTSVKEPSTESPGVTHDVTPCFHGRGQCITPKLNRKMLFFMPQISIFRLRRSDRRLRRRKCRSESCSGKSAQITSRRSFASKLGLLCLAWSGGCIEGVLEGVWERHDVGRIFFRFDLSDFFGQNG